MRMLKVNQNSVRKSSDVIHGLLGADKKSIAIQARGFDSPIAFHHINSSRAFMEIVGMFKYSSSSSAAGSVLKSSSSSNKLSQAWGHWKILWSNYQYNCQDTKLMYIPKLRRIARSLILNDCLACSRMSTAHGEQCAQHQSIPEASSWIGNMITCIWDKALTDDANGRKEYHQSCSYVLMAHRYMTDSSVFK